MNVSEWTKAPEVTFWASDGKRIFQARYVEHAEEEVQAGADEGHFSGVPDDEDGLPVVYVWTGEEKPEELPPEVSTAILAEVDQTVREMKVEGSA